MSVVAVAGGTGDFGQLIVQSLIATGRHQVYTFPPEYSLPQLGDDTLQ